MKGKTVIYCAHRLSSIVNVDKIHVVKDGKLVQQGTHKELIADTTGSYAEMWQNIDNSGKVIDANKEEELVDEAQKI